MRRILITLAMSLMTWTGLALADDLMVEPAPSATLAALPFTRLTEMQSTVGEDKVAFLKRVGVWMTDYAKANRVEVCGMVSEKYVADTADSGTMHYGIVLTTTHSNILCASQRLAPEGFTVTTTSIHNHGYYAAFKVNAVDEKATNRQFIMGRAGGARVQDRFSPVDELEAGYLATPTGLLYQDGKGHHINYGDYDKPFDYTSLAQQ